MGLQRMSEKSTRRLSEKTGIQFFRSWNSQGDSWLAAEASTEGRHKFYKVRHGTYEVTAAPPGYGRATVTDFGIEWTAPEQDAS